MLVLRGCLTSLLAACAAKEYFPETPVLLILQSKINKTGVSGNFEDVS
jgi:hypothetical protein